MADEKPAAKGVTPDWLVRGVLTKVGDIFDRLMGRGWKPSSSLATSELIERLKALLDSEARDEAPGCKFVPNNIELKMQWDKFSTDSDKTMQKLETELLAAAVDHINDRRYFTHAPLAVEVKPDYFTPGVRLMVSFDKFADEEREAEVQLAVPGASEDNLDESIAPHASERTFVATYTLDGSEKSKSLDITKGKRLSVGRTKENDLAINDQSISKIHASLTVDDKGNLIVADTGSTNGTFVNGERIAYGKAVFVGDSSTVRFGAVDVLFRPEHIRRPYDDLPSTVSMSSDEIAQASPAPTERSIPIDEPAPTEPAVDFAGISDNQAEGETV
jgi:pSer/pThr/pTyr-binding forkhead associated (FHA) protein